MQDSGSSAPTSSHAASAPSSRLLTLCSLGLLLCSCGKGGSGTAERASQQAVDHAKVGHGAVDHVEMGLTAQATGDCSGVSTVNLAQGRVASASSLQILNFKSRNAFDGKRRDRWSSAASDPQWVQVNLGGEQTSGKVALQWEGAYAKAFRIEVSNDATTWTAGHLPQGGRDRLHQRALLSTWPALRGRRSVRHPRGIHG